MYVQVNIYTQVLLDGLAVKIKGFLGNQPGTISKVQLCLLFSHILEISLLILLEIFNKTLERLLIYIVGYLFISNKIP